MTAIISSWQASIPGFHRLSTSLPRVTPNVEPVIVTPPPSSPAPPDSSNGAPVHLKSAGPRFIPPEKADARSLALNNATRSIIDATELVLKRRLDEYMYLTLRDRNSSHEKKFNDEDDKRQSLEVARAVRKTILAERKLAAKCIKEAKLRLQASYDMAETVETKLLLAERMIGSIMADMTAAGLIITLSKRPAGKPCRWPPDELVGDDSDESGTDLEMDMMEASTSELDDDDMDSE